MRIDIVGEGTEVGSVLRTRLEQRLYFALGRFSPRVRRIRVRLDRVNGRDGSNLCRCAITVQLQRLEDVVERQSYEDFYAACDRAVDRVGRMVARRLATARAVKAADSTRPALSSGKSR